MILLSSLKKTMIVSIIGHITVFSIFGFSFGNRIPRIEYASVSFWGQFLGSCQVSQPTATSRINQIKEFFNRKPDTSALDTISRESIFLSRYYSKPPITLAFNSEKEAFIEKPEKLLFLPKRAQPSIIFHPLLPYGFTLYFKDRQVAHVELMFKITSEGERSSILLKRKISSGNLEVDLLVMRYIGRYLFIQRSNMPANNWQIVKIDLSAENDK